MKKFLLLIVISFWGYCSLMAQTANINSTNVTCFSMNEGSIDIINPLGGTPPYEYSIDGTASWQTSGTYMNLMAGIYNVWIRDALFSEVQLDPAYMITEPMELTAIIDPMPPMCPGGMGSINIQSPNGGSGIYEYSIDGASWQSPPIFNNIITGIPYQVYIRDFNSQSCFRVINSNVIVNNPPSIVSVGEIVSESCSNQATGTINLSNVSGGTPPYNYSWSNTMTGSYIEYLSAGFYEVTITDINGCFITRNFNVNQFAPFNINVNANNVSCTGMNNGTATANVSGGNPTYLYYWGPDQYEQTMDSLAPGSYIVYVTDAGGFGCTFSANYSIYEPSPLQVNKNVNNVSCAGQNNGSVDLNVYGGNMPYTFTWSSGATTEDVYNLAFGKYYFTVTDYNNCTKIDSVEIFNAQPFTLNLNPHSATCYNSNNGWIESFATGGSLPYNYNWSNGTTGNSILYNLQAGFFSLTVTDMLGCLVSDSTFVNQPAPINIMTYSTSSTCGNPDGMAWCQASGGIPPYNFYWSTNSSNDTIFNLSAGAYLITVTDSSSCIKTSGVPVNDIGGPSVSFSYQSNVSCWGGSNGMLVASATGGILPYSFYWTTNGSTNDTLINLTEGTYIVQVTDSAGCMGTNGTEINQPEQINALLFKKNISCFGDSDGGLTVSNIYGGIPPYTFLWSNSSTNDSIFPLAQGAYSVTITDFNNCFIVKSDSIINPPVLQLSLSTNSTCPGNNNGSVYTNVTGGTPGYHYIWNIGYSEISNLTYVYAGTYTVTVTDDYGCIKVDSAVVNSFPLMDTSIQIINPTCHGQSNGAINLEVTGGTAPFTYSWNSYPNNYSTQDLSNIPVGFYNLTITDASSCIFYGTVNITEPAEITLNPYVVNVSSCGLNDGIASVNIQNGIPPFTYNWGIYGVNDTVYNIGFGTYNVIVTDINGCTGNSTVIINEPSTFSINHLEYQPKCFNGNDGAININPIGTSIYSYNWSNSATTDSVGNLIAGNYFVTVTDTSNCNLIQQIDLGQPNKLIFNNINIYNVSCNGAADANISVYINGGTCCFTYDWSHDTLLNGTSSYGLIAGSYTITVTDANACFIDTTIIITQPPPLVIDSVNVLNISCANFSNGHIKIFAHGGIGNLDYTINDYNYNPNNEFTNLYAGSYSVRVKDNNYCLSPIQNVTLTQPQQLQFDSVIIKPITCYNTNNGEINIYINGGIPPYQYSINGTDFFSNNIFSGLSAGNYMVSVRDSNNCFINYFNNINIYNPSPIIAYAGSDYTICEGQTTNLYANGGLNYLWSNSETSSTIAVSPSTTTVYSVIASDANGCTGSDTVIVNVNPLPTSNAGVDQLVCANSPDVFLNGVITDATGGYWTTNGTGSFNNSSDLNTAYTPSGSDIAAGFVTLTLSTTGTGVCSPISDDLIVTISPFPNANAGADLTLCIGQSANLTATGGNTYSWSNGAITASTSVSPTITTTYTVTATNANGCMDTDAVMVTINALPIANAGSDQTVCSGTNLNLSASGGNTYSWSGPIGFTSSLQNPSITNSSLANSGTYYVTVTNSITGCWADTFTVVTVNPSSTAPSSISATSNPICQGNSTTLNVNGGSLGTGADWYWYSGACGGTFEGNGASIIVSPTSNKIYYVRAEGTCNSTVCGPLVNVTVDILPTAYAGTDAIVCDTNSYSLSASFGGSASYGMWSTNGTGVFDDSFSPNAIYTPSTNDVLSGSVTISFTTDDPPDACASAASDTMILTINQAATVNAGTDQTVCDNNANVNLSGNVTIASGGIWTSTGTGTFSPSDILLNATYMPSGADISAGNVTLTLTSTGNGICAPVNDNMVIGFNPIPTSSIAINNVSCNAGNNGSANLTVTGGTLPYTYSWSNLAVTQNITGLSAGTYTVTITDSNGCSANANATIIEPPVLTAVIIDYANESCTGLNDGAAIVNGVGGTGNYTYLWSNAVTDSANYTIAIGNYSVTVTDANSCQAIETITINSAVPFTATLTSTNPSCFGSNNGSVSVSTSGGIGLNNYYWNDSLNASLVSTLTDLPPGNYTVTVIEDGNMCQAVDSIIITDPAQLLVSAGPDQIVCEFGTVQIDASGADFYSWSNGSTGYQLNDTIFISTTYIVTGTDMNGCTATDSVFVQAAQMQSVNISASICEGGSYTLPDNSVVSTAGLYELHFFTSFGCDSVIFTNLTVFPITTDTVNAVICDGSNYTLPDNNVVSVSGEYPVTLFSTTGCDSTIITFLNVNEAFHDTINAVICQGDSYTMPDNSIATTAGIYPFNNTTSFGCDSNLVVNLSVNPLPVINFTGLNSSYCKVDTFILLIGNYSTEGYFSGNGMVGGNVFNPVNANIGNNTINYSYTDNNGCTNTDSMITTINEIPELTSTTNDASCGQNNGSATLSAIGGALPYTYSTGSSVLSNLSAGVTELTVTDFNGCSSSGNVAINNIGAPTVSVLSQLDASCSVSCDGTVVIDVVGGAEPYTFLWSDGETAQNPISLCPGESFVEVTDLAGCITSTLVTVGFSQPDPTIFGRITYSGGGIDGQYAKLEIYSTSQHVGGGFDLMNADVQIGSDGSFIMANFPPDIYILKVLLIGNNPAYANLMNSYYIDTLTSFAWETADSIVLGCGNYKEANIIMHEMFNAGTGSGSMSGSVSYPGEGGSKNIKGVYITEGKLAGEPVPGAEIYVELEPDDQPIANTTTDTAGAYFFEELPEGNYSITVEIPGFPMVSTYTVAITTTDSVFDQLNFFVDTTVNDGYIDTTLVFVSNEEIPAFAVSVYPNPYKDYLNISYKITKTRMVSIDVFDIKGSKIESVNNGKQTEGEYNFSFDPKKYSLMPGTYFVQLRVDNSVYLKKVVMIK